MIYICSNCGHNLPEPLCDGNCEYDLSDNLYDRLMSAAWTCYRQKLDCADRLHSMTKNEDEALLVAAYMIDNCYGIDEFRIACRNLGIKK